MSARPVGARPTTEASRQINLKAQSQLTAESDQPQQDLSIMSGGGFGGSVGDTGTVPVRCSVYPSDAGSRVASTVPLGLRGR